MFSSVQRSKFFKNRATLELAGHFVPVLSCFDYDLAVCIDNVSLAYLLFFQISVQSLTVNAFIAMFKQTSPLLHHELIACRLQEFNNFEILPDCNQISKYFNRYSVTKSK